MLEVLFFFICSVVIGAAFLFFGYAFFRILLPIWGFFAGLFFGLNGMEQLLGGTGVISVTTGLLIGIVLGIVLAAIAWYMYNLAVYLFAITVGYVIGSGFIMAAGLGDGFFAMIVGVIFAVGLVAFFHFAKMPQLFVVFVTAAAGAMAVVMGIFVLFGVMPNEFATLRLTSNMVFNSWFWVIVWIVLTAIGMAFQSAVATMAGEMSAEGLSTTSKKKK